MIAIEQYRAAIGCFHPKCVVSNHPKYNNEFPGVNDLLKFMIISLMNWIRGSLVTCFGLLVCSGHLYILCGNVCLYVNTIGIRRLIFCVAFLQLNVLALWFQLLLLCGDIETNAGPVCQKFLADTRSP